MLKVVKCGDAIVSLGQVFADLSSANVILFAGITLTAGIDKKVSCRKMEDDFGAATTRPVNLCEYFDPATCNLFQEGLVRRIYG